MAPGDELRFLNIPSAISFVRSSLRRVRPAGHAAS
jgi:hypothetical protein